MNAIDIVREINRQIVLDWEKNRYTPGKCNASVGDRQCKNGSKAGCTMQWFDEVVDLCQHHYNRYTKGAEVRVFQYPTGKKVNVSKEDETMKADNGIFTINHREKGMVKCVKCSKTLPITDPENDWSRGAFHSIEDLRKCMGAPKPNVVASTWKGKSGDTMQTKRFTDKLNAIAWAKDVKGVFKVTGKGTYTVTWKVG